MSQRVIAIPKDNRASLLMFPPGTESSDGVPFEGGTAWGSHSYCLWGNHIIRLGFFPLHLRALGVSRI